uniref:Zinc finger, GRF-type n=1 Tax=Tanacetum cinerariifolium TaxID=118510 RepID=A0A6L2LX09_TANCI|nr:zinc finger, GRF-type [Tanacetum cinerariifolium]
MNMEVRCPNCGGPSIIRTSWTTINPARRFCCCAKRGINCGIIDWYDPPMCPRSVQVIPCLLRSMNELQRVAQQRTDQEKKMKKMLLLSWLFFIVVFTFMY